MRRSLLFVFISSLITVPGWSTLHAELSQFDKWRLEDAKREWHNERHQGFDLRVQQNDYQIREALRRGEEGDPFWESDFNRLMEDRQRTRRNLEAIERANDAWERERRRGSNNLTDPLDHRIRNTLNGAEYDDNGFWKDDFNRQMHWSGARGVRMGNGAEEGGIGRTFGDLGAKGEMRMGRREMGRLSRV